jgi:hypothetical protein
VVGGVDRGRGVERKRVVGSKEVKASTGCCEAEEAEAEAEVEEEVEVEGAEGSDGLVSCTQCQPEAAGESVDRGQQYTAIPLRSSLHIAKHSTTQPKVSFHTTHTHRTAESSTTYHMVQTLSSHTTASSSTSALPTALGRSRGEPNRKVGASAVVGPAPAPALGAAADSGLS